MRFIPLKKITIAIVILSILGVLVIFGKNFLPNLSFQKDTRIENNNLGGLQESLHPLSIEYMRQQTPVSLDCSISEIELSMQGLLGADFSSNN